MIVMNHDGDLFEERRKKEDRRRANVSVTKEKRKEDRRKININEVKKDK